MRQVVKWGCSSVGGLLANLALLTVWVEVARISPWVAIFINFAVISAVSYVLANWWIFGGNDGPTTAKGHAMQWAGMEAGMFTGKAANYLIFLVLLPLTDYRIAWTVGAVATFGLTFTLNKWWFEREGQASI